MTSDETTQLVGLGPGYQDTGIHPKAPASKVGLAQHILHRLSSKQTSLNTLQYVRIQLFHLPTDNISHGESETYLHDKAGDGLRFTRIIDSCQWLPEVFVCHHSGAKVLISDEKTKFFFGISLTYSYLCTTI